MKIKTIYGIVAVVIIAAIVVIIMMKDSDPKKAGQASNLPPGHPSIDGMAPSEGDMKNGRTPAGGITPSKDNVRKDFLHLIEKLREKVNANPKDTSGVLQLAQLLHDSHQMKESAALYERYLKAAPKDIESMISLSDCYFTMGQMEDAIRVTDNILKVNPKNTIAMYNLGAIYATKGDKEKAKEYWQNLIDKYPSSEDATRAKESLGRL